jgi:hypothetical protein
MRWFSTWSIWNLRTQDVLRVALLFLIATLIPGWIYWRSTGARFAHCLYGDSGCSAALATYLLCGLSLLAFCAAFEAVKHAYQTLQQSSRAAHAAMQSARVAVQAAKSDETCHLAGSRCDDMQCPHSRPGVSKDIYIDDLSSDPITGLPPGSKQGDFLPGVRLDLICVGKAPAINARLWLVYEDEGFTGQGLISIGTIEVNNRKHLNIYIHRDFQRAEFSWSNVSRHDGPKIVFHPDQRRLTPEIRESTEASLPQAQTIKPERPEASG